MAFLDPSNSWLAILFSGLVSAVLAAVFTHWIERRKERVANCERTLVSKPHRNRSLDQCGKGQKRQYRLPRGGQSCVSTTWRHRG